MLTQTTPLKSKYDQDAEASYDDERLMTKNSALKQYDFGDD